ncbi:MAG: hypothetical protein ABIH86_00595 [Planctomycetota bacterium]
MGYALLWLESVIFSALFTAFGLQIAGRQERKRRKWALAVLTLFISLCPGLIALFVTLLIKYKSSASQSGIGSVIVWNIVAISSAVYFFIFRFLKCKDEPETVKRSSKSLIYSVVIFGAATVYTFVSLDNGVKKRMSDLKIESGAIALSLTRNIDDSENAAYLYREVFETINAYDKKHPDLYFKISGSTDTALSDEEVNTGIDELRGELEFLRRASRLPDCSFDLAFEHAWNFTLPHLTSFRKCAQWLSIDAQRKASQGDLSSAMENIATLSRMSYHLSRESVLISFLVAVSIQDYASKAFNEIASKYPLTPKDIEPIQLLEHHSYRIDFQRAMRMEKAWGLSLFGSLSDNSRNIYGTVAGVPVSSFLFGKFTSTAISPFWRVFYLEEDVSGYRSVLENRIDALSLPYYDNPGNPIKSIQENNLGLLSSMITPTIDLLWNKSAKADAHQKVLMVSCAVVMYKSANGKYPEKYADLVPDYLDRMALDPFDGQLIRLAARGNGVIVYSVGENLTDDNGDISANEGKQPTDIGIRIGTER